MTVPPIDLEIKYQGLSTIAAQEGIKKWGYNESTSSRASSLSSEIKKVFLDPMGLMLLVLSGLYFILGDKTDAIILLIAFFPVTAVDVVLGIQSGKALKALRGTLTTSSKLFRDGKIQEVLIRNIVPDDLLVFEEGQTLPADGLIVEAENLSFSEAALTGEAIPVTKLKGDLFLSGTTLLTGRGIGLIQKTGKNSRFGSIAKLMEMTPETKSQLRKTVDKLVKLVLGLALGFAILLFVIEWRSTHQFIPSLIVALTLGMAAVPEEFPLVFTLYLSLGAWHLSKKGILIKSLPSVEALGGVDVICTDKTGTLTEGVFQLEALTRFDPLTLESQAWAFALMACEPWAVDALEIPIVQAEKLFRDELKDWVLIHDYPFDSKSKTMSHVWHNPITGEKKIAMKGAAEGVLLHCLISPIEKIAILKTLDELAGQGKRVLGLAGKSIKNTGTRSIDEIDLKFIGFLVFSDPVRNGVKQAIQDCQAAGIKIKMLTGDHLLTAHSIADQIGLTHSHSFLYTGEMIEKMDPQKRKEAYLQGAVFARVTPEQKFEMVKALQSEGLVVGMTGDGINDAPALQLSDIGISMGESATDVARSAARMVLLNSDFSGIVAAVFEGRRIFSNLRRSFSYLISFHVPVILLALVPPFLGWPPILMPIHIILLELVVHPVSAFTFENIVSENKEKNTKGVLLSRMQILRSSCSGLILSVATLFIFNYFRKTSPEIARSAAFAAVLFGNLFFVLANTFPLLNLRFYMTALSLCLFSLLLTMTHAFGTPLHFDTLNMKQLAGVLLISALATLPSYGIKKNWMKNGSSKKLISTEKAHSVKEIK